MFGLSVLEVFELVVLIISVVVLIFQAFRNYSYQLEPNEFEIHLDNKTTLERVTSLVSLEVPFILIGFWESILVGWATVVTVVILRLLYVYLGRKYHVQNRLICSRNTIKYKGEIAMAVAVNSIETIALNGITNTVIIKGNGIVAFSLKSISRQDFWKMLALLDQEVGLYKIGVSKNLKTYLENRVQ